MDRASDNPVTRVLSWKGSARPALLAFLAFPAFPARLARLAPLASQYSGNGPPPLTHHTKTAFVLTMVCTVPLAKLTLHAFVGF